MPAEEIEKWLLDEIDGGLARSPVHRPSIAFTLDRYGHLLPSLDADIANGFDWEMQAAKANRDRKVIDTNFGDAVALRTLRTKVRLPLRVALILREQGIHDDCCLRATLCLPWRHRGNKLARRQQSSTA